MGMGLPPPIVSHLPFVEEIVPHSSPSEARTCLFAADAALFEQNTTVK